MYIHACMENIHIYINVLLYTCVCAYAHMKKPCKDMYVQMRTYLDISLPQQHTLVMAPAHNVFAVTRPRHTVDPGCMALHANDLLPRSHLPHLHSIVTTRADDVYVVRRQ